MTFLLVLQKLQLKGWPIDRDKEAKMQIKVGKLVALLDDVYKHGLAEGEAAGHTKGYKAGLAVAEAAGKGKGGHVMDILKEMGIDNLFGTKPK